LLTWYFWYQYHNEGVTYDWIDGEKAYEEEIDTDSDEI
jgi:hypothetical protein